MLSQASNSFDSGMIQEQRRNVPNSVGPINNMNLSGQGLSLNAFDLGAQGQVSDFVGNQSFSQMSQIGENLAESRDYENPIN